ncbi:MAG TPA: ESPR domain-containing protein, partial [Variovorax sp.]|nr:ESPR domain-containing protein [Variovorax sp.]
MNTIHRTVWNHALGAWVAAPETARSRRKGGVAAKRAAVPVALAVAMWVGVAPAWSAGGSGGVPESFPYYHAGTGGSAGGGGIGGLNDSLGNASAGTGGSAATNFPGAGTNGDSGTYG